jgi:hypothetical protein
LIARPGLLQRAIDQLARLRFAENVETGEYLVAGGEATSVVADDKLRRGQENRALTCAGFDQVTAQL